MALLTKRILSGSTTGLPIKITATTTPGTTVHTAVSGTTDIDEIYLYASNLDTSDRTITIEWGGTTDPDHLISKALTIPAKSPPIPIVTGLLLQNGLVVKVFASTANVITITGFVNRFDY